MYAPALWACCATPRKSLPAPRGSEMIDRLAGIVVRYGRKVAEGEPAEAEVLIDRGGEQILEQHGPLLG